MYINQEGKDETLSPKINIRKKQSAADLKIEKEKSSITYAK